METNGRAGKQQKVSHIYIHLHFLKYVFVAFVYSCRPQADTCCCLLLWHSIWTWVSLCLPARDLKKEREREMFFLRSWRRPNRSWELMLHVGALSIFEMAQADVNEMFPNNADGPSLADLTQMIREHEWVSALTTHSQCLSSSQRCSLRLTSGSGVGSRIWRNNSFDIMSKTAKLKQTGTISICVHREGRGQMS